MCFDVDMDFLTKFTLPILLIATNTQEKGVVAFLGYYLQVVLDDSFHYL